MTNIRMKFDSSFSHWRLSQSERYESIGCRSLTIWKKQVIWIAEASRDGRGSYPGCDCIDVSQDDSNSKFDLNWNTAQRENSTCNETDSL